MDAAAGLRALGGTARPMQLRRLVGRAAIRHAVAASRVHRVDRVYALPAYDRQAALATQLRGVRSHQSAAASWGLALPPDDGITHVTVPHKAQRRNVPPDVRLHYRDLTPAERASGVTSATQTVVDCLRDESLGVALSVGDSALRLGLVTYAQLAAAVGRLRGPGSRLARERLALLDARAANAFESCMRAILIAGGILGFEPQVSVRSGGKWIGRVDLAHRGLRIVIECDGFETHGGRAAFVRDLRRHTQLTTAGWRTLRFTWEQVMFQPEWVLACVRDAMALAA